MKKHATLIIYNSKPDTNGNRYFAFEFMDHVNNTSVHGYTGSSTGGNIALIRRGFSKSGEWDEGIEVIEQERPIRVFNWLV